MRAIPQKIYILKFIGEQGIVTVSDVTRYLFQSDKSDVIRITMHQLGIAHGSIRAYNMVFGILTSPIYMSF